MSLLREIQEAAVSSESRVSDLLRKCKILATRLKSEEFEEWVERELNGYRSKEQLPEYRIFRGVQSKGNFHSPYRQITSTPIPITALPKEFHDWAYTEYMNAGISTYEHLLDGERSSIFMSPWSADVVAHAGRNIIYQMTCLHAWKEIPRGVIANLLDSVRNRVLSFALEIEKANPDAGDAAPNVTPIPEREVSQVYNNIFGNVANSASGSSDFTQQGTVNVTEGNFDNLAAALKELGLTGGHVAELKDAVGADKADEKEKKPGIGKRVGRWLGKMMTLAATGVIKVGVSTAGKVLPELVSKYYGLPPGN